MKKLNFKKILYILIAVILLLFLVFNNSGIIKYIKLRHEVSQISNQIKSAEKQIENLNAEIDSVKTNLHKIEKIAREKYHMIGPKEQALKVEKKE